ncbi:MAG: ABC transporter ATP-binding protein [Clostridia bacterium]|nr:ABC transporter ATP-binding protein [Clostridia bacterium]
MIKFNGVFIQYVQEFYSLYDCNLKIDKHTILVEKNLCGCSAVMRVLSQIDKHYTGEIFVDDINLKNIKDKDLSIAYLPENPVLFKNKSLKYNLSFPLKIRKMNKKLIENQINSIFFEYNLTNFEKKTKKLNLSEQKIIALLRTFVRRPKYVLLENFFENLDKNYYELAIKILNKMKENSIVIACENDFKKHEIFKDFEQVEV